MKFRSPNGARRFLFAAFVSLACMVALIAGGDAASKQTASSSKLNSTDTAISISSRPGQVAAVEVSSPNQISPQLKLADHSLSLSEKGAIKLERLMQLTQIQPLSLSTSFGVSSLVGRYAGNSGDLLGNGLGRQTENEISIAETIPLPVINTICIADSLNGGSPTFLRPNVAGPPGPGSFTCPNNTPIVSYHQYEFDLQSCSAFPTNVTMTLCDSAASGCGVVSNADNAFDTIIYVYRTGGATGAGGAAAPFNPGSPCNNLVYVNDDLSGACSTDGSLSGLTQPL